MLGRYALLSSKIRIRYADPYTDPGIVDYFGQKGISLNESDLLVEGPENIKQLTSEDIFIYNGEMEVTGLRLEERLTNAILQVNTHRTFSAAFTTGHGERPSRSLEAALSDSGFSIRQLALMAEAPEGLSRTAEGRTVPAGGPQARQPQADIIIIPAPERDFLREETDFLRRFMDKGGRLLVFLDPGAARLPELEDLLGEWGMQRLPGIVMEPIAHTAGNPASSIPFYGMHEINRDFAERGYYLALPNAESLEIAEEMESDLRATRLLLSTQDAYKNAGSRESVAGSARDASRTGAAGGAKGSYVFAALVEKSGAASNAAVMLFASRAVYADDLMAASAYANREYLAASAAWLAGRGVNESVSIPPKTLAPPSVHAGFGITLLVFSVFIIILPLASLAAGALIIIRRRRR
jgi:ABC-2 type transport system permease protein